MNVLMIDTATAACSVALAKDIATTFSAADVSNILNEQNTQLIEEFLLAPRRHAEIILSMIETVLQRGEIKLAAVDLIAFTTGSGSFIGVRTAAAVVQGIAFAADIPTLAVPTLQLLAQRAAYKYNAKQALVAWDARMGEVYWGLYSADDCGFMQAKIKDQLSSPLHLKQQIAANTELSITDDCIAIGNGWSEYADSMPQFTKQIYTDIYPHAADMLLYVMYSFVAGNADAAVNAAFPGYLRQHVADKPNSK